MPKFGDRKAGRKLPENEHNDPLMVSRLSRYMADDNDETTAAPVAETIEQTDYAQLGEHVGAVLEAATEAAKKMRLQATDTARQIRADAELQARAALEEARERAKRVEGDAAVLEAEAKTQSAKIRGEAEAYAGTTREAADTEAAGVLDRAERQASERVRTTQARLHTLDENVAGSERRLRELAGRLRELASSLDDLVSDSGPSEEPEPKPATNEQERVSLTGVLTQSVAERRSSTQTTERV